MDRATANRMKWRCRRGLLELDLLLARLLASEPPEEELAALAELLALPDHDLWDIASGRSEGYEPRLATIVARLRAV